MNQDYLLQRLKSVGKKAFVQNYNIFKMYVFSPCTFIIFIFSKRMYVCCTL